MIFRTLLVTLAMMLGSSTQSQPTRVEAPRSEAIEWFKAGVPFLGTIVDRRYALRMQENNNETQVQLYSTQMNTLSGITIRGYDATENVSLSGMDYASKLPSSSSWSSPSVEPTDE